MLKGYRKEIGEDETYTNAYLHLYLKDAHKLIKIRNPKKLLYLSLVL